MTPADRGTRRPGGLDPSGADGQQARDHLRRADPVLARLIDAQPDFDPRAWLSGLPVRDAFSALVFQVIGQQLSVQATRRILARLADLAGGRLPGPEEVLALPPDQLRAAGLSGRKVATLRSLAGQFASGCLSDADLARLSDDEIEARLTAIPGIGSWTVHGFLIIALNRPDVVLPATWPSGRRSSAGTGSGSCPPSRRCCGSLSPGGPTAAWPAPTCSSPPSSPDSRPAGARGAHHGNPACSTP
ncbi:MAG: DNA-3-methyladenine glycosylase family protein, partial [Streptosporangiales bacterium]